MNEDNVKVEAKVLADTFIPSREADFKPKTYGPKTANTRTPSIPKSRLVEEHVVGSTKLNDDTKIEFKSNPKRSGSKAHGRYEQYQVAKTVRELRELNLEAFKADLRYDLEKGFCKVVE